MGAVSSKIRTISTAFDFIKDINQRSEFAKKFFNDEHDLAPLALAFMIYCKPSLWSLVLVCSKEFRRFFGDAHQRSLIAEEDMQHMYQYLIIDPISKMQWLNKIDEIVKNYPITNQGGLGICWSHAIATAIYLSQSRIVGRHVDDFLTIRQRLLNEFGYNGQNPASVMKRVLPRYKLHFSRVYPDDLGRITRNGRVCVAGFYLNGVQWYNFSKFFNDPQKKKLPITAADINRKPSAQELQGEELESGGHAVVLTDANKEEWTFINSWGEQWADGGLFRVQPGAFDVTFYDVFWYESDLSQREIRLFQERGQEALGRFYQIVEGIDPLLEEKKNIFYDLGSKILFIIRACAKIVRETEGQSVPKIKEVGEIISPIEDATGGQLDAEENDSNENQITIKEDRSVVINDVQISAQQIDLLITFLAGCIVISDVTDQLKEMSDNFWRDA